MNRIVKDSIVWARNRYLELEAAASTYRRDNPTVDRKLVGIVCVAAVCITMVKYYGARYKAKSFFEGLEFVWMGAAEFSQAAFSDHPLSYLFKHAYWSAFVLIFYGCIPFLYLRFVKPQVGPSSMGLGLSGALAHWRVYVAIYLAILIPLFFVSEMEAFQAYYPIYKPAGKSMTRLLLWEAIYLPTFLAVEFLFRGFFPIMPYCMIHFGKPIPETLGAIVAGLALGWLALFTRSIWLGVAIHVSVALTMDLLSLWQKGSLPFLSSSP